MFKMNDTGQVKGRLRPLRALCCFRSFVSITRRFFEFFCQPKICTCTEIVLFDTGSCVVIQPDIKLVILSMLRLC